MSTLEKLTKAQYLWNSKQFFEAAQLYQDILNTNPELIQKGLSIRLAHCLILAANWSNVSHNLVKDLNYLERSGWLQSLAEGKPVNFYNEPIPWYTYPAIEFLEDKIQSNFVVFEFGSGQSTLWWASKAKKVISIESDEQWFEAIRSQMPDNVELYFESDDQKYANFISNYPNNFFDVVIVDGINRNECLFSSAEKVNETGIIIFDNIDDPQYDKSIDFLVTKNYKKIDFWGLIPSYTYKNCTTIFFQSNDILSITSFPSKKISILGDSCMQIMDKNQNQENIDSSTIPKLSVPIALIIFNRPDTTAKVFEAIRAAQPSQLFIIADGPRSDRPEDREKCAATRAIVETVDWFCEVVKNYSEVNLGCRQRMNTGISWVFEQVEEAIILEDDCLADPSFFPYCQTLLEKYRNDRQVMMISGQNLANGLTESNYSYGFSRYTLIWGWATWRRAWQLNDTSMTNWLTLKEQNWLEEVLKNQDIAAYWSKIFQRIYDGFDTWDYTWLLTLWYHQGLTIVPSVNLVKNIGFGSEATHTKDNNSTLANRQTSEILFPLVHPPEIKRDIAFDDYLEAHFYSGISTQPQTIVSADVILQNTLLLRNQISKNQKLNLENISLVAISSVNTELNLLSLALSSLEINFGKILFFTSENIDQNHIKQFHDLEIIPIAPIPAIEDYSAFVMNSLNRWITTEFCLLIQHDAFVLNPEKWSTDFLNYDYIGAPWNEEVVLLFRKKFDGILQFDKNRVGNGGFSLRSKKFLNIVSAINFDDLPYDCTSEDIVTCHHLYEELKDQGICFAPLDIAAQFSMEEKIKEFDRSFQDVFGFHGKSNYPLALKYICQKYPQLLVPQDLNLADQGWLNRSQLVKSESIQWQDLMNRLRTGEYRQLLNQINELGTINSYGKAILEAKLGLYAEAKRSLQSLRPMDHNWIKAQKLLTEIEHICTENR